MTFREDIPYATAMKLGRKQDEVLIRMIENNEVDEEADLYALLETIKERVKVR